MRIFRKLAQLLDVDLTTNAPADGDSLTYDSASSKWVPEAGGAGGGAPTDVNYLVGTASGDLSAEIVVGTSPGGELGGTWATPTVDETHSGSSHASVQAAAEATAAAALSSHASDTTGIHGIADTSALLDTGDIGATVEAHDADLTTIAGLSPTNDDVLQRKAGSWVNRTMAQLIADLAALGTTFASLASFNDHSARHENGGADEISVAGLSGQLADNQPSDSTLFDSGASTDGQVLTSDGAGGAAWEDAASGGTVPDFYKYLAASLEPLAIETGKTGTYSFAVGSNETKLVVGTWNSRLGSTGRWEIRDPGHPLMPLRNVTVTGLSSDSLGVFIDPTAATYEDAYATYYERLQSIYELPQHYLPLTSPSTRYPLLPGPYGSIITSVNVFDLTWVILRFYSNKFGMNIHNEIGDTGSSDYLRVAQPTLIPISKLVASTAETGGERTSGVGKGALTWINCPSDWGAVADANTYLFRDDFMGSSLDTAADWTRAQSTAGNVEISTLYNWSTIVGNANWGDNGLFSQTGVARAQGRVFLMDVFTASSTLEGLIVGAHDGSGHSYSDFAHGLDFTNDGSSKLQVFENGNDRGAVGSGYSADSIYRVRITLGGSGNATYEIQGGSEYAAIGGSSWNDITPGTSSSATSTLHIGASAKNITGCYIGDPRIY